MPKIDSDKSTVLLAAELQRSEERYRSLVETAMDGFFVADAEGRLVEASQTYAEMSGYSVEELLSLRIVDLNATLGSDVIAANILRLAERGVYHLESQHRRKNGSVYDVAISAQWQPTDGGRSMIFVRDITARKRTEEVLHRSQALLNATGQIAKVGGWQIDLPTQSLSWTNEVYRIHEVDETFQPTVAAAIDFYAPESKPVIADAVQRAIEHGEAFDLELQIVTAKDARRWVRAIGRTRAQDGKAVEVIGTFQDITERKQHEESLKRSETRLRRLVDVLQHASESTQDFLDYALAQAIELTGSKIGYLYHYHADRKEFILNSWSKDVMAACAVANSLTRYELDKTGIWGEAVRQRRPMIVNDFQAANALKRGYPEGHVPLLKFMTVPIFRDEAIVGVVGLANKEADYDESDVLQASLLMEAVWKVTDRKRADEDLARLRQKSEIILLSAAEGILGLDLEGNHTFVNPAAAGMLGYEVEELLGRPSHSLWHHTRPDGSPYPKEECMICASHRDGEVHRASAEVFWRKDGTSFPAEYASTPIREQGRLVGSVVTFADISERKQHEEALRLANQKLRLHFEQTPIAVIEWDLEFRVTQWNPAATTIFGFSHEEAVGQHASIIVPEAFRIHVDQVWQSLLKLRGGERSTNQNVRKDGTSILCEWYNTPLVDEHGTVAGVASLIEDITARKRSEEALRESEGFLQETQRVANLGSYVMNTSTGSWRSSDVLDGIFGIGGTYERSVEGWANLIHPEDRAMVLDYFSNDVLGLGHTFDKEYRIVRHDNRVERWVHGLGTVQFDADGRPLSMHGTIQDITARKRAEEDKAKLEGQLQQAQKMESVGRLAGGVAHDFNNMLGVILGHVELAIEQVDPTSPLHEDLEEIRKAARRSADLTRQLLAFARKQTVAPKVLDLNDTVAAMLTMLGRLIGEDIHLAWAPGKDVWSIKADPSQIDQILANLCVNARDAIGGVGKLTIETGNVTFDEDYCAAHAWAVPGDYVRIAVSDDGCGMDRDTQSHLFEPFFTTKAVGKGTGLGLATVYGIVKQNHGSIEVYSELGHGTTFKIYLPRHHGTPVPVRPDGAAEPTVRGHETILVVEDEPAILRVTKRMLEHMGYMVLAAGGPSDAIRLANDHPGEIHLLMTDVIMPEMNGRDLAKNLLSRHPGMKRVFMSGYTAEVIASHGVLEEGVKFIQKPFSKQDLAAKVREALDGG